MSARRMECPDCGAWMEQQGERLRCPWAHGSHLRKTEDGTFCGWPYGSKRGEITAPIHGRVAK